MSKRRQESVKAAAKLVKVKVEGVEECGGPMDCVIGSDSHPAIAWAGSSMHMPSKAARNSLC